MQTHVQSAWLATGSWITGVQLDGLSSSRSPYRKVRADLIHCGEPCAKGHMRWFGKGATLRTPATRVKRMQLDSCNGYVALLEAAGQQQALTARFVAFVFWGRRPAFRHCACGFCCFAPTQGVRFSDVCMAAGL